MKISFPIENRFRFMYRPSYFFGDFNSYKFKYENETSHFVNSLYFDHNERRFHFEFYCRIKCSSKLTGIRIDISFGIECLIRNEND